MIAFKVYVNGKKRCVAGIGDDGVLAAIVNSVRRKGKDDLALEMGGLISHTLEHVKWLQQEHLRVGDRIKLEIIETDSVDEPVKRYRTDPRKEVAAQKSYVRRTAKHLGWKIQERPRQTTR
jgi:hypothetical protein